ncbi:MAG: N-acetyltransferase [Marinilabiliales bacterium]|nr:MAG: N-acetyltransferase [Marinilabiliales bacterium]
MEFLIDKNIVIRKLIESDTKDIFNTIDSQREYLGEWLPFVEDTKEISYTQDFVDSVIESMDRTQDYIFTIRYDSKFAGIIGFKGTDSQNKKTEIGYWLAQEFQGKGLVSRAVKILTEFAFGPMNMNRVQIKVAVKNYKSKNIPERLGYKLEGIERNGELLTGGIFTDLYVYSKLKADG